eukprot:168606_1
MITFVRVTFVIIITIGLINCAPLDCSTKGSIPQTSDLVKFCSNTFDITEDQFIGDPEVRYYKGYYYMSMTVAFIPSPGVTYSHIMMASYNEISQCWDNLIIVTNDTSTQSIERDEVSTFLITPNGDLYLYYNHLLTDAITKEYIPESFSIRVKHGTVNSNTGTININSNEIIFLKDVNQNSDYTNITILETSIANTFVLYISGNQSPDLQYTIHPQFISTTCFPITEPSVIQHINTSNYYLSLQCLDFNTGPTNYEYGIKIIKANNIFFINENWSDFILSPNIFCNENNDYVYPGWTAGTFLIHNNEYYMTVSPNGLFTGKPIKGYAGCLFFKFKDINNLQNVFTIDDIVGELSLYQNHLGSCSGGQMYIGINGIEINNDPLITYFWQKDYIGFYHIYNTPWSDVNFIYDIDTTTSTLVPNFTTTLVTTNDVIISTQTNQCYGLLRCLMFGFVFLVVSII